MKKLLFCVGGLVIVAGLTSGWLFRSSLRAFFVLHSRPPLPAAVSYQEIRNSTVAPTDQPKTEPKPAELVKADSLPSFTAVKPINLAVPFTSQAPFGKWDTVHEETCEEASVLMVDAFFGGRSLADKTKVDEELLALVAWENQHFGYFEDTTAEETAVMIREFYGYEEVDVIRDVTIEDIKKSVLVGLPVIIPAYGRGLGNPNFTAPGPLYHMLVVRGVTAGGKFITNDPGTRNGEGYIYDPQVLFEAIHDWNGGDVQNGTKVVIVVKPNK